MSAYLWKFYLEDDVESFLQVLHDAATATTTTARGAHHPAQHQHAQKGHPASQNVALDSPASYSNSQLASLPYLSRSSRPTFAAHKTSHTDALLTRQELNRKDGKGMTLLHHAASSPTQNGKKFALALIAHPNIDLYLQDSESGWTPLHRAFYFGNIAVAHAIIERDAQDAVVAAGRGSIAGHAVSLIKVKDFEGNGPYDVLTATITNRPLHDFAGKELSLSRIADIDDADLESVEDDREYGHKKRSLVEPLFSIDGDELFTFGSNKNITLGLGNEDDRQYPERVAIKRPDHLFHRFHREHVENRALQVANFNPVLADKIRSSTRARQDIRSLPSVIRSKPLKIQHVEMSKFHTAVLTCDPVSNLYVCGHGLGGRLGTGTEKTQFNLVCIDDFGGMRKRIVAVALGQDHTLAVTDKGEIFSWGSNAAGQLGLGMSKATVNTEEPVQLIPKQIFGVLKKEIIVGVAASRLHSVAHTNTALYTWGKNEGQLGIVDAQARSLEVLTTPRRIAASRFSSAILSVSAIDKATVCLLENREVHVFANYGQTRVAFPLDGFTNYFLKKSFMATRYDETPNTIVKIASGGDTICALSSAGEVFAINVEQRIDPASAAGTSTTNPNKIRQALSTPARIWSLKKGHMSARDVGVDQDGSIVLTTEAGSVWRRVRRATLPNARPTGVGDKKSKDFKFTRVPGLTRVIAVCASSSGAYAAVRRECDVTREQILVNQKSIWADLLSLLPFNAMSDPSVLGIEINLPVFWKRPEAIDRLVETMAASKDLEKDMAFILSQKPNDSASNYGIIITSTVSNIRLPTHRFVLGARSRFLRDGLANVTLTTPWITDLFEAHHREDDVIELKFIGVGFLALAEFVLYCYTDRLVGYWLRSRHDSAAVSRYNQVRTELMKIASKLEMRNLESAVRRMSPTLEKSLDTDFEIAMHDLNFFSDGDAVVELSDGELSIHSDWLSRRCPFFEGMFQGRAGALWLSERREVQEKIPIDMKHVEMHVFQLVLRHIYADTGEELFDEVVTDDVDEFLDLVLDVLSVANELMLDRLSQICQKVLGSHVSIRNVCQLLNAVAPSSIEEFKTSGLEYLCLNLEAILSNHVLEELDEDLLEELDAIVKDNQLSSLPFAKSGRSELELHERYPQLAERIHRDRKAKIDAIMLQAKYQDRNGTLGSSLDLRGIDDEDTVKSPPRNKTRSRSSMGGSSNPTSPMTSPTINPRSEQRSPNVGPRPIVVGGSRAFGDLGSPLLGASALDVRNASVDALSSLQQGSLDAMVSAPKVAADKSTREAASPSTRPWGAAPLASTKLGIKEIMEQSGASRTSSISLGLAASKQKLPSSPDPALSPAFSQRMSQKERRKLQSQQAQQIPASPSTVAQAVVMATPSPTSRSSPWLPVNAKASPISSPSLLGDRTPSTPSAKAASQRSVTTPQLTMRQTVAHAPKSAGKDTPIASIPHIPQTAPSPSTKQRSQSTAQVTPRPTPPAPATPKSTMSGSASKPVEIQSIRHVPKPAAEISPTFFMHQSMADILSQQEAEKTVIKESGAKRSLQEIQQEQEFQAWWDMERQRVIDEEEARAALAVVEAADRAAGAGGRGKRKGRTAKVAAVAGVAKKGGKEKERERERERGGEGVGERSEGTRQHTKEKQREKGEEVRHLADGA